MGLDANDIAQHLAPILQQKFGASAQCTQTQRLTTGASAQTWKVVVDTAQHTTQALILRLEGSRKGPRTGIGKVKEAQAQMAARAAGVPVPEVLAVFDAQSPLGEGYLMTCLDGESLPKRLLGHAAFAHARSQLVQHCAHALAGIHRVPLEQLADLPDQPLGVQINQLRSLHRGFGEKLPVFELALRWLEDNQPEPGIRTLVHGDFRMGNFLVNETGLIAVLDWELAHIGDPLEDIGWLCAHAWRFGSTLPVGGFARRDTFYAAYCAAGGREVVPAQVRYWEIYAALRWGIICQFQAYSHLWGRTRSVEKAAIGRRVAEAEHDLMALLVDACR